MSTRIQTNVIIFYKPVKEDAEFVSEAILQAIRDATEQAKKKNDDAMSGLTGGMQMPGLF